jgi:hypothetical protein
MTTIQSNSDVRAGFSFELCNRNAMLQSRGGKMPKATKTGTTIVGVIFKVNNLVFNQCIQIKWDRPC